MPVAFMRRRHGRPFRWNPGAEIGREVFGHDMCVDVDAAGAGLDIHVDRSGLDVSTGHKPGCLDAAGADCFVFRAGAAAGADSANQVAVTVANEYGASLRDEPALPGRR